MQTTLALSNAFAGARVLPSAFSTIINQAVGPVLTFSVASGGSGYTNGQQIRLLGGNNDCILSVVSQSGGVIISLGFVSAGTGYTTGSYATTRVTGSTGSGCIVSVNSVSFNAVLWRSGATKGSAWTSSPALTPTWRSLAFASVAASATCALTVDAVSGATAGVTWTADQAASVVAEGQRLVSRIVESVRVQREVREWLSVALTLTDAVNVGRSATGTVNIGE
jgi:hypothetical protein